MKKKVISGMLVTMFLVTMVTVTLPVRVSAQFAGDVEYGIVGPKGWIQWDGLWDGARMARDLINKEGYFKDWPGPRGILGPDGWYKVVLVDIDEHAVPVPDPSAAISELLTKLDDHPNMGHLIGGFHDPCVLPMEEALLDYAAVNKRPIWIIAGSSPDEIIEPIKTEYAKYKYMFRNTPMNATTLGYQLTLGLVAQIVAPKMAALYYGDPTTLVPAFVIAERLDWCDDIVTDIQDLGWLFGLDTKGNSRPSPLAPDFSSDFDAAETEGAKLVIHLFSAVAGANFIKQYGEEERKFAMVGINVESQMQEFYASIDGACEYETFLSASGTQEGVPPLNPDAKPLTSTQFWDIHKEIFGHTPIYTAWSAYDTIIGFNETSYDDDPNHVSADPDFNSYQKGWMVHWKAGDVDKQIEHIETLGVSDGFAWKRVLYDFGRGGAWYRPMIQGLFKYTGPDGTYHDVFSSPDVMSVLWDFPPGVRTGVGRAHIPQWQAGRMEVTFPRDQPFSRKWMVPDWMYSLETDFAGGPLVNTSIPIMDGEEIVGWYNYTTPDRIVYEPDFVAIAVAWFKDPLPFNLLEADMQPYDYKVDVYDAARVGMDWDKTETPQ